MGLQGFPLARSAPALRRWLLSPIRVRTLPRGLVIFWTFCLLLRFTSPPVVALLSHTQILQSPCADVNSAPQGDFVVYGLSPADKDRISTAYSIYLRLDFPHFNLRFELGPPPQDSPASVTPYVAILIRNDASLSIYVHGKASYSLQGDPEIRLNARGIWTWWTILHEAEHHRLNDPCLQGLAGAILYFLVDFFAAHDVKLFFRHLFPYGDWFALAAWLVFVRWLTARPYKAKRMHAYIKGTLGPLQQ